MAWFPIFVGSCWASFCFQWPENFTYSHDIPTTDASIGIYVPTSIHCRSFYQTNFKCHYCSELRNLLPNKVNDKFVFASFDSDPPPPPKLIYSEFLYYRVSNLKIVNRYRVLDKQWKLPSFMWNTSYFLSTFPLFIWPPTNNNFDRKFIGLLETTLVWLCTFCYSMYVELEAMNVRNVNEGQ